VEFKAFGMNARQKVRRFEEGIEAVKRLWSEETVDMKGSHFELVGASCPLKPVQQPHPPIWIGANADKAIERAAKIGTCWYINPHNTISTIKRQLEVYKKALDSLGKPFPDELPIRREVFVARTREEALAICRPYLEDKYKTYHAWGQSKAMPEGDNNLGQELDELLKDRFLIGSPEEVTERLVNLGRETGVNHVVMSVQWPGMPQNLVLDTMQLLAEEVFPNVRAALGA
jgi:alkanesulfonate monooxygenase SsuD/methylene tetrahydromethanopterin reductase-like flavin-dependent oxidoreductase (luciferase family)